MKNITRWLTVLGLALGASAPANAAFIETTWTDTHTDQRRLTSCGLFCDDDVYQWTHDISDGADGYRPWEDIIGDAWLTIWLSDDGDSSSERADIDIGSFLGGGGSFDFSQNYNTFDVSFFGWLDLSDDGRITFYIDPKSGDFFYNGSQLVAEGWRNGTVAVPEPGTLALLAIGLIGMGVALSRRRNQK